MAKPRVFAVPDSQAGVFHVVSRIIERTYRFADLERERFVDMMRSMADFHQVEILTYCVMGNHFHILVRVPDRPEGFDLSLEDVLAKWGRAVGSDYREKMAKQMAIYEGNGSAERAMEAWRQRMLARMFSLSEFMKALKQRFTQWYNGRNGRKGTLWESRYRSTIVQDEGSALRTMAAYIDLNPVRAGIVSDPSQYRWCGYADAMAGRVVAQDGLALIVGVTPARMYGQALGAPEPTETPALQKRRRLKAVIHYRQILGQAGLPVLYADGRVKRKGVSKRVSNRLLRSDPGIVKTEQVLQRVRHLTDGVVFGSRAYVDEWFERNRAWFSGQSQTGRKTGARSIGKGWRGLYNLRQLKAEK